MHWAIQENLFGEKRYEEFLSVLKRWGIPHSVHKVIPFAGELLPELKKQHAKVIWIGSYSVRKTAEKYCWNPGVYDLYHQTFPVQLEHWGDYMLNADSKVRQFRDAEIDSELAFVRPIHDSKEFVGAVYSKDEFDSWKNKVVALGEDYGSGLNASTIVQVCSLKRIYAEYRCWVVEGKVVTASMYKRGDHPFYSPEVDELVLAFARDMIKIWNPHRAYVLDVCETPIGMKIVEINTINASGLYAGNIQDIVMALEDAES